jgi:hypothetical protein
MCERMETADKTHILWHRGNTVEYTHYSTGGTRWNKWNDTSREVYEMFKTTDTLKQDKKVSAMLD